LPEKVLYRRARGQKFDLEIVSAWLKDWSRPAFSKRRVKPPRSCCTGLRRQADQVPWRRVKLVVYAPMKA
jgi:hypothetical protein